MEQRGGGAILVSTSSSVKEPIPNLGLSTVLRASVSALAKTLALELAAKKIRVNQIIPGRIDTTSYILAGLAAVGYAPDAATDALARYVRRRQLADGGWRVATHRPPIESNDIAVTALSVRALGAYAPAPFKAEYERAVRRATAWLANRDYVTPDDVRAVAHAVLRHRLNLSYDANADGVRPDQVVDKLLEVVAVPA